VTDTLTNAEIEAEKVYRKTERLAILLDGDDRDPTPAELNLAFKEAREWESTYREQNRELSSGGPADNLQQTEQAARRLLE
jgi:hypothetical protein